jgi:hypothetical protein
MTGAIVTGWLECLWMECASTLKASASRGRNR